MIGELMADDDYLQGKMYEVTEIVEHLKPTKKHPDILVDIGITADGMKVPANVYYPSDEYAPNQIRKLMKKVKKRIEAEGCPMCKANEDSGKKENVAQESVPEIVPEAEPEAEPLSKEEPLSTSPLVNKLSEINNILNQSRKSVEQPKKKEASKVPPPSYSGVFKDLKKSMKDSKTDLRDSLFGFLHTI